MTTKTVLRILILSELALITIHISLGALGDPWLSEDLRMQAYDAPIYNYGIPEPLFIAYAFVIFIGAILSWIRLWMLRRYARTLYVFIVAISIPWIGMISYDIMSAPEMLLDMLSSGITGAILALLYCSDLSSKFQRNTAEQGAAANP